MRTDAVSRRATARAAHYPCHRFPALRRCRPEERLSLVAWRHGRGLKVIGDGVLVEFGRRVNAVEWAGEPQHGMAVANDDLPESRRIVLRIAISLSDVMIDGSDLYGDGVNVAARLKSCGFKA